MRKMIRLGLVSPLAVMLALTSAYAADPVNLVGESQETAETQASPVDSALAESMEAPAPQEKAPVTGKSKHHTKKTRGMEEMTSSAMEASEAPLTATLDAKDSYKIRAGDVLQITVWKEDDMNRELLVLPDGTISFPLIGSIAAQGLTPSQLQSSIKHKLRSLIPDASVNVVVKAALGHAVSVIGQVAKPGEIIMGHQTTVMQALSQAGGLTPFADEDDIIILRRIDGKETSIEFPYDDVIKGRNLDQNITLLPGDVVVVPTAGLF